MSGSVLVIGDTVMKFMVLALEEEACGSSGKSPS